MQYCSSFHYFKAILGKPEFFRNGDTVSCDTLRMAAGIAVACFDRRDKCVNCIQVSFLLLFIEHRILDGNACLCGNCREKSKFLVCISRPVILVYNGDCSYNFIPDNQRSADKSLSLVSESAETIELRSVIDIRDKKRFGIVNNPSGHTGVFDRDVNIFSRIVAIVPDKGVNSECVLLFVMYYYVSNIRMKGLDGCVNNKPENVFIIHV